MADAMPKIRTKARPISSLPKISPCSLGVGGDDLWATKSEDVGIIVRTISFQDFQPGHDPPTSQTDRRRDRRHAIDYSASRGNNVGSHIEMHVTPTAHFITL